MKIPLISQLKWLKRFVAHPAAEPAKIKDLFSKAEAKEQIPHRWKDGAPLSQAHNAHYTNTAAELKDGLTSDFNFLEGDVWLEGAARQIPLADHFREPIMAHAPGEVTGLTLNEWLSIGKRAGKGLKIDIKHSAAIPKIIEEVKAKNLPEERLIFNSDVIMGPGVEKDLKFRLLDTVTDFTADLEEMTQIREAFPHAILGLGHYTKPQPAGTTYSDQQLREVIDFAEAVGGPITFPLRAEFVTPAVVARLKPHGSVSIWNDPKTFPPGDKAKTAKRFRDMGVDGMIDLRGNDEPKKSPIYDKDLWPPKIDFTEEEQTVPQVNNGYLIAGGASS